MKELRCISRACEGLKVKVLKEGCSGLLEATVIFDDPGPSYRGRFFLFSNAPELNGSIPLIHKPQDQRFKNSWVIGNGSVEELNQNRIERIYYIDTLDSKQAEHLDNLIESFNFD